MNEDCLYLQGLTVCCRIGVTPAERRRARRIVLDLTLYCDLARAGRSDDLADTVDYAALVARARLIARAREWRLLETLAAAVADACLADRRLRAVRARAAKPHALSGLAGAAVEIFRARRPASGKSYKTTR